jgi:hypothetical protein
MTIAELKNKLKDMDALVLELPSGEIVPLHFHITEVGMATRNFIDCGGTMRTEMKATLQVWEANDFEHRLSPAKLSGIISQSESIFPISTLEVEVEYQRETINTFGLDFDNGRFRLLNLQTDCLAKDKCGVPPGKQKVKLSNLTSERSVCTPGGGCC